jgi:hypothetical protein
LINHFTCHFHRSSGKTTVTRPTAEVFDPIKDMTRVYIGSDPRWVLMELNHCWSGQGINYDPSRWNEHYEIQTTGIRVQTPQQASELYQLIEDARRLRELILKAE